MLLIERMETICLGGPKYLRYLEYNGAVFVNRSSNIKSAIRKIKKQRTEFSTKQSTCQMESVACADVSYNMEQLLDVFPEYFI